VLWWRDSGFDRIANHPACRLAHVPYPVSRSPCPVSHVLRVKSPFTRAAADTAGDAPGARVSCKPFAISHFRLSCRFVLALVHFLP
jgi:hypothetical protein